MLPHPFCSACISQSHEGGLCNPTWPHFAVLEVIWHEHSFVNLVLGPTIVFISQRFLDVFQQGLRYLGGVTIDGIHQYPLMFCKVSYECVVSCFSPFLPIYKQAGNDWPYIKTLEIKQINTFQPCSELQHPNIFSSPHQPCFPKTHHHQKTPITTEHKLRQPGTRAWFGEAEERCLLETQTTKQLKKKGLNKLMPRIQAILWTQTPAYGFCVPHTRHHMLITK